MAGWVQLLVLVAMLVRRLPAAGRLHGVGAHVDERPSGSSAAIYRLAGVNPDGRAAVDRLRDLPARVLAPVGPVPVRAPAGAGVAAAVAGAPRREARSGVQHRDLVRDQHELAVVRGRVDDGPPRPDGGARRAELRVGRGRDRGGDRARSAGSRGAETDTIGNFWSDLVRSDRADPAADRVRRPRSS